MNFLVMLLYFRSFLAHSVFTHSRDAPTTTPQGLQFASATPNITARIGGSSLTLDGHIRRRAMWALAERLRSDHLLFVRKMAMPLMHSLTRCSSKAILPPPTHFSPLGFRLIMVGVS